MHYTECRVRLLNAPLRIVLKIMFKKKTYFVVIADKQKNNFRFCPLKKNAQNKICSKFP